MWAQLITVRENEVQADVVNKAMEQFAVLRAARLGTAPHDCYAGPEDPARAFVLVVFESEEKARARENDPRRQESDQALRTSLADVLEAAPEYTDLKVLADLE